MNYLKIYISICRTADTIVLMKEKRSLRYEKYQKMSTDEFTLWIKSCKLYRSDGGINGNIISAVHSRNEKLSDYYSEIIIHD